MPTRENLCMAKGIEPVRQEELPKILSPYLGSVWQRLLPSLRRKNDCIQDVRLVLHPFWFIKVKTSADRIPFPPKIKFFCIYIDAVTGERGLTDRMPEIEKIDAEKYEKRLSETKLEDLKALTDDLVESLILRRYLLKRPKIEIAEPEMIYLLHYHVQATRMDRTRCSFVVNVLSGEVKRSG